eukprot:scaffold56508_cov54-Attheya_sp.AAC.1
MGRSKRNSCKKNSDGSFAGANDANIDHVGPPSSDVNSLPCICNKLKPSPKELDYCQRVPCKQHLGNEKGCVRTICQAFGVDHTDPHWSYVLPRCIPINSLASKHKLSDHFHWECWNCNPTKFKTIIQKKSRLTTSISPPVVPNSANEPNNKKDPPPESEKKNKKSTSTVPKSADEPDKKKDPPPPPESEKKNTKKSITTVPKSADEPNKKKDPPPPPESEKKNMKKSTATVPKSADEADKKKDLPPPPESEKKKNKKSTAT